MVVGLSSGRHCGLGSSVEGVEGRDYFVSAVAVQLAVATGELQRPLIGLGPAVAKEHQVQAAILDKSFRQPELGHGVKLVGGLNERPGLLRDSFGDYRVAVAQLVHRPTGHEVQVFLPVGVPDLGAFASNNHNRLAPDCLSVVFIFNCNPFPAACHGFLPPKFSRSPFKASLRSSTA